MELSYDASQITRAAQALMDSLDPTTVKRAQYRAVVHGGGKVNTAVKRAVAAQTGLKARRVSQALSSQRRFAAGEFRIIGRDSYTTLKEFAPVQGPDGVTASPWGRRTTFDGAFLATMPDGSQDAFRREGRARLPIEVLYGPAIPVEMVRDESASTFFTTADRAVLERLEFELLRAIGG